MMKIYNQDMTSTLNNIDRRTFLRTASAAAVAISIPSGLFKDVPMGIVVHSYGSRWNSKITSASYPAFTNAIDLLEHCHAIGGGGIQVGVRDWTGDFVKKIRERREKLGLYLEGSIMSPRDSGDVARFEQEINAAREAGVTIERTVCTTGRRYEVYHSQGEFVEAQRKALASLQLAEPVLRKHKVKLAVENHKDWRATELAELMKTVSSEWIGVTLDFGNSIALMEDPMEVVQTLAPYALTTHVKDMGVDEYEDGFLLSEVPLGEGILDLGKIIEICRQHNSTITFNLEMITRDPLQVPCLTDAYWSTFEGQGGQTLARILRLVKKNKFEPKLPYVSQLTDEHRLAVEEQNILTSLSYSQSKLRL
jgi:sugar phosphate isomerase/epimerase